METFGCVDVEVSLVVYFGEEKCGEEVDACCDCTEPPVPLESEFLTETFSMALNTRRSE
jgi:hypothetical protein